jgi:hypothetical protein
MECDITIARTESFTNSAEFKIQRFLARDRSHRAGEYFDTTDIQNSELLEF